MKETLQFEVGGIRTLVRSAAEAGSMTGRWPEPIEQTVRLERSGSVFMPEFDRVSATFEATKYRDERHRLRTIYLARVAGSQLLVSEELSDDLRQRLARATVSTSVSEMIIQTDTMSTEPDEDGDPMEFFDDDTYLHTQSVEYRINGNGQILECIRSDEYAVGGETAIAVSYSEPYQKGQYVVGIVAEDTEIGALASLKEDDAETLEQQLATDLALLEHVEEYRNDTQRLAESRKEHENRIYAILAFITLRGDPNTSLQIALS